jgi:aspartate/methionine/tyrosine aminotransferase
VEITRFAMERWQSVWENRVDLNISESGIAPLTVRDLLEDSPGFDPVLDVKLGYPQSNGSEELRANIAAYYPGARIENVLVTSGCAEANFLSICSLAEPGAEVVLMMPNYMQVPGVAASFGATLKPLWLREDLRWGFDPAELKRLVGAKTRLIAICNPNNPTGAVLSEELMDEICRAASRVGAWILADEVYRGAEFSGQLTPTFWGRYERVLCTGGLSKAFALPGLRTGWVVGPAEDAEKLWSYKDYTTIGISVLADRLAAYAMEPRRRDLILERTRRILRQNYTVVSDWVTRHKDTFAHIPPAAGAIAWIRYGKNGAESMPSLDLAEALLKRKSVLIVPGKQFEIEGYIRVGFGYSAAHLRDALERVDEIMFRMMPSHT